MKVVFLSQRVPYPPDRGDRITTWHLLRHLLDRGATVRVGALAEEPRDRASGAHLEGLGAVVAAPPFSRRRARLTCLRGLLTGSPLSLPFFHHRTLERTVRGWLREDPPDLLYVYSGAMAQYALDLPAGAPRPHRVMQFAELDSDKWRQFAAAGGTVARWIYGREARLLLEFERRVARSFDLSCVVSRVEKELFQRLIPDVEPLVLPNGVDVDHFRSAGDARRDPHTVVFTGVMDYPPNVEGLGWFAKACWPAVRRRVPDARLLVVGSRPLPAVRALDGNDGIEVTGRVDEVPPWLDRAAVAIAPLRLARGVQNKVLEAMSTALPVVASTQAAQGLGDVPGEALIVADGEDATTRAVIGLLEDPGRARRIGRAAAEWVRAHFRWEDQLARLDAALERITPRTG